MAEISIDYTKVRNPQLREFLENDFKDVLFSIVDGHDHDGTNSKALSPAAVIANDSITTDKIVALNVTTAKIANDAITTDKIAAGAVTATEIAANAVVTAGILNANVTADKLASDAVTTAKLAADAVETAKIKDANVTIAKLEPKGQPTTAAIADPGHAGAIAVTNSGTCPLVSAGAETRTIAAPTFAGQRIVLACKTYVGNIVVTASAAINQTGNTTITLNGAGDFIELVGVELGGAKVWRVSANDGCALSTP